MHSLRSAGSGSQPPPPPPRPAVQPLPPTHRVQQANGLRVVKPQTGSTSLHARLPGYHSHNIAPPAISLYICCFQSPTPCLLSFLNADAACVSAAYFCYYVIAEATHNSFSSSSLSSLSATWYLTAPIPPLHCVQGCVSVHQSTSSAAHM